jgi:hypothetical protein
MFVPATSSASQAASIAAQAASKDSPAEGAHSPAANARSEMQAAVEKSNSASPDRDAQGQGDGLPHDHHPRVVDELELQSQSLESQSLESQSLESSPASPRLPDEPPSQLDIVG